MKKVTLHGKQLYIWDGYSLDYQNALGRAIDKFIDRNTQIHL